MKDVKRLPKKCVCGSGEQDVHFGCPESVLCIPASPHMVTRVTETMYLAVFSCSHPGVFHLFLLSNLFSSHTQLAVCGL